MTRRPASRTRSSGLRRAPTSCRASTSASTVAVPGRPDLRHRGLQAVSHRRARSMSLGPASPIVRALARLLGMQVPRLDHAGAPGSTPMSTSPMGASTTGFVAGQPIAGSLSRLAGQMGVPAGRGWEWSLTTARNALATDRLRRGDRRPDRGLPAVHRRTSVLYDQCLQRRSNTSDNGDAGQPTTGGGTYFVTPPQQNAQSTRVPHHGEVGRAVVHHYDFTRKEFASQLFSLQRELHDWHARCSRSRARRTATSRSTSHLAEGAARPQVRLRYARRIRADTPAFASERRLGW